MTESTMSNLPILDWQPGPLPDPQETALGRFIIIKFEGVDVPTVIHVPLQPYIVSRCWEDTAISCCDPDPARYDRNMVCLNQLLPFGREPDNTIVPFHWSWWDVKE